MARITAPNKEYAGVSAGVSFSGGEGHTDNPRLIDWFRSHGYLVDEEKAIAPAQLKGRKQRSERTTKRGE